MDINITDIKDLAPWIAIAITLALSILVPLFTQIANNRHQRKIIREKYEREEKEKKTLVFESFMTEVGGVITAKGYIHNGQLSAAGGALHRMYAYAPNEWFEDLDRLAESISRFDWEESRRIAQKLCHLITIEINKQ